jgi:hypothetical protein
MQGIRVIGFNFEYLEIVCFRLRQAPGLMVRDCSLQGIGYRSRS